MKIATSCELRAASQSRALGSDLIVLRGSYRRRVARHSPFVALCLWLVARSSQLAAVVPCPLPPTPAFLPPATLASLSNLELIARTAVDGFLTGLHRSPHYGFSQEFKEYRAYVEGDDPRFVDWNVYARTERTYIRRFEGETNTR